MVNLHPFRALKRLLPRGLFGRSLIIIVAPVVILQGIVTYAFFERHYDVLLARMGRGAAADVVFLTDLEEKLGSGQHRMDTLGMAARDLGYKISVSPGQSLARPFRHANPNLKDALTAMFERQLGRARPFTSRYRGPSVEVNVQVKDGVLSIIIPRQRLVAPNVDVSLLCMVSASIVL